MCDFFAVLVQKSYLRASSVKVSWPCMQMKSVGQMCARKLLAMHKDCLYKVVHKNDQSPKVQSLIARCNSAKSAMLGVSLCQTWHPCLSVYHGYKTSPHDFCNFSPGNHPCGVSKSKKRVKSSPCGVDQTITQFHAVLISQIWPMRCWSAKSTHAVFDSAKSPFVSIAVY